MVAGTGPRRVKFRSAPVACNPDVIGRRSHAHDDFSARRRRLQDNIDFRRRLPAFDNHHFMLRGVFLNNDDFPGWRIFMHNDSTTGRKKNSKNDREQSPFGHTGLLLERGSTPGCWLHRFEGSPKKQIEGQSGHRPILCLASRRQFGRSAWDSQLSESPWWRCKFRMTIPISRGPLRLDQEFRPANVGTIQKPGVAGQLPSSRQTPEHLSLTVPPVDRVMVSGPLDSPLPLSFGVPSCFTLISA